MHIPNEVPASFQLHTDKAPEVEQDVLINGETVRLKMVQRDESGESFVLDDSASLEDMITKLVEQASGQLLPGDRFEIRATKYSDEARRNGREDFIGWYANPPVFDYFDSWDEFLLTDRTKWVADDMNGVYIVGRLVA